MKRFLVGSLILVVITVVTIGGLFFLQQKKPSQSPEPESTSQAKKVPSTTLKEYSDPSGFSFQYPQDVSFEKKENNDSTVYADLAFSAKDIKGSMVVFINDTSLKTIDEWSEKIPPGINPENGKDAELAELKAKEIQDERSIMLAAVDQGVLFTINVTFDGEKDFWTEVYKTLAASFSFTKAEGSSVTSSSSDSTSEDVIFEGEEVIE